MEPLFTNKCTYTKPNLIEVGRGTSSHKAKTILFIGIGFIFIVFGLLTTNYIYCLLGTLLCIIYPLFLIWAVRYSATNRYQQLQQLYHGEAESVTSFYEDRLVVRYIHGGSDVTVAYPQVAKVYETKNLFFLMLSTRIGFMLEKQGFEGTTADEFGEFIRARAVGEGQADLKKRNRKTALIKAIVLLVLLAIGFSIGFLGPAIENIIPKTFTYGDYSIKLTNAFDGYDGEWYSRDVTVYCYYAAGDDLSGNGLDCDTAAAYLQAVNDYYGIDSVVTADSDNRAWTAYKETYDGTGYYNYDYVIESGGGFWYTEFCCLTEDTDKYAPLFEKWAQTIAVSLAQ
ncbi:MAG: YcxB family protein [Bacillota bacterium]